MSRAYDGRLRVQQFEGGQREGGQRLVEREVLLEVDGEADDPALARRARPAAPPRRRPAASGRSRWPGGCAGAAACAVLVVVRRAAAASPRRRCPGRAITDEQHRVADPEPGGQRLRVRRRCSFSKVSSLQPTKPSGAFLRTHLAALLRIVAGLGQRLLVLDDVLGGLRDDVARRCRSRPGRPARRSGGTRGRAARRTRLPSYLVSAVNSTVRIGTLTPTPSVSVPQMTFSRPGLGEPLHQAAVLRAASRRGGRRCRAGRAGTGSGRTWW